jgi:hypothetical protein
VLSSRKLVLGVGVGVGVGGGDIDITVGGDASPLLTSWPSFNTPVLAAEC